MNQSKTCLFFFSISVSLLLLGILILLSYMPVEAIQSNVTSLISNKSNYSLTELYDILEKSVVQIDVYDSKLGPLSLGSGFVFDSNGHIVTNQHVAEPASVGTLSYDVIFPNGRVYGAKLIGADPFSDLAVIRIENTSDLEVTPLRLGNSTLVKPGEQIAILGSARGLIGTFTTGIVSAVGRFGFTGMQSTGENILAGMSSLGVTFDQPEFIQTDAAVNHGNSGGPAVNMRGEVIGISDLGLGDFGAENLNFLIPSDTVKRIIPSLISSGTYKHPWLGLEGVDMTSSIAKVLNLQEPKGFLVVNVDEGGPASKAGILGGDRIVSLPREGRSISIGGDIIIGIDGNDIRSKHDLLLYLTSKKVGDSVELSIIRNDNLEKLAVILGERPGYEF
ncbi:MAG TPA: trypsin-like peptidase domain-containing protein [Nitrososphaeraceae archaeon]